MGILPKAYGYEVEGSGNADRRMRLKDQLLACGEGGAEGYRTFTVRCVARACSEVLSTTICSGHCNEGDTPNTVYRK